MPIQLIESPDINYLQFAHNNSILIYESNYSTSTILKSEIIANIGLGPETFTIYPNPSGVFRYNLKGLILSMSATKTNKYRDDIGGFNIDVFDRYISWDRILSTLQLEIKIYFADGAIESLIIEDIRYINAVRQLINKEKFFLFDDMKILSPTPLNNKIPNIKCWYGYPFDIAVHVKKINAPVIFQSDLGNIFFENDNLSRISRIIFSDGSIDDVYGSLFNYTNGQKNIYVYNADTLTTGIVALVKMNLEFEIPTCYTGHYIKWVNSDGAFNYWLFRKGDEFIPTKQLGDLENDFYEINNTISPTENIGVDASNNIDVYQVFTKEYIPLFRDMLISPKVYLFNGLPEEENNYTNWVEIKIKSNENLVVDKRFNSINAKLTLELPEFNTKKI